MASQKVCETFSYLQRNKERDIRQCREGANKRVDNRVDSRQELEALEEPSDPSDHLKKVVF